MWIPADAAELERAVEAATLEETHGFDGKRQLPDSKKNLDLAIDVAAMTTSGGVLIYGIDEDTNGRLTIRAPFDLTGAAERVGQIVESSIAEPPLVRIVELSRETEPGRGYLVVEVPPSPRAPHQVVVRGEMRYYGRGARGNRMLAEAEVALLHARRAEGEKDADALLDEAIAELSADPDTDFGYLYAFAQPNHPLSDDDWERARAGDTRSFLADLSEATRISVHTWGGGYDPSLYKERNWRNRGADAFELGNAYREDEPAKQARAVVTMSGRGLLFVGRAAQRRHMTESDSVLWILEALIAGNLASFLALMGCFFERAGYPGGVIAGVAATGLSGGYSHGAGRGAFAETGSGYRSDVYRRIVRLDATELVGGEAAARKLVQRLVDSLVGNGADPFKPLEGQTFERAV